MMLRLIALLLLASAGCAHSTAGGIPTAGAPRFERVETRVGTFVVRAPGEGAETGTSPAEQLKVVLAGGEAPTVFYAGVD
ncbi:MAG TPA: hypothetical protein VK013_00415 [Myxococcaceae bacterium]|nr:hypothetical protein [Myxococcaceae bacterium]